MKPGWGAQESQGVLGGPGNLTRSYTVGLGSEAVPQGTARHSSGNAISIGDAEVHATLAPAHLARPPRAPSASGAFSTPGAPRLAHLARASRLARWLIGAIGRSWPQRTWRARIARLTHVARGARAAPSAIGALRAPGAPRFLIGLLELRRIIADVGGLLKNCSPRHPRNPARTLVLRNSWRSPGHAQGSQGVLGGAGHFSHNYTAGL